MDTFDERKKRSEFRFSQTAHSRFKVAAKRNKLLGLWLAEKMGYTGSRADNYALEVIKADMEETGEEDVFRKLRRDCNEKGILVKDKEIREKMEEFYLQAEREVEKEI